MKNMNCKALTMSLLVAIIMLLPFAASAQRSDSFFSGFEDDDYENRIAFIGLGNQPFGTEPAPVGSGLLVLTVAGAGYAALRRKRSYKTCRSYKTYMLALAMLLAFTGCKKKIEPIVNSGETAHITLNVGNGNRHIIEPNENGYVPVSYSAGDVIYVGDGTQCVGQLSWARYDDNNNSIFSGSINEPSGNKIYFYFIGGKNDVVASGTTSFTVDISDQHTNLPVLSCKEADYYSGKTEFTCMLENKCALVEFALNSGVNQNRRVKISNMLSEATINFANPGITPTGKFDAITIFPDNHDETNTKRWAILMAYDDRRDAVALVETAYESNVFNYYDNVVVPQLNNGDYIYEKDNDDLHAVRINNNANTINNKVFTVSANGNVVRFAPSNLQYKASSDEWRFAEKEWDYVGGYKNKDTDPQYGTVYINNVQCSNTLISETYTGWIDLFGWGCTGYQDIMHPQNNDYCKPYCYTYSNEFGSLNKNYGPQGVYNISVANKSDWGCVDIQYTDPNDPNKNYKWRTLTKAEVDYLFNNVVFMRYGYATITDGDKTSLGLVILPDNVLSVGTFKLYGSGGTHYNDNIIAASDWNNDYHSIGAVFLPITEERCQTSMNKNYKTDGAYWLASTSLNYSADYIRIQENSSMSSANERRSFGHAVRLVR